MEMMRGTLSSANFRLNSGNMRFLPFLLEAERLFGISPPIIATIITAEAVTRPFGGNFTWDECSMNDRGEAAGLAQFTRSSWLSHARRIGSVVNRHGCEHGFVDADGHVLNEAGLLDARLDARLSILATAEMARRNWTLLERRGLGRNAHGAGAQCKMLYLAHHEGGEGAYIYLIGLRQTISRQQLKSCVPQKRWPAHDNSASRRRAYYDWLEHYIDRRIDARRYLIDSADVTVPPLRSLGRPKYLHILRFRLRQAMVKAHALRSLQRARPCPRPDAG